MNLNIGKTKFVYPSLNGIRAISIFFVISHHLEQKYHIFSDIFPDIITDFITDGQLGVNFFFIISSFLITTLLLTEESNTNAVSLKKFYIRRTLRIFPAYYFYLLFLFVLHMANIINISKLSWLTAVTYTKYINWQSDWYTAHAWSLSIEEQFYLFFPLLFMFGNNIRKTISFILILFVPVLNLYIYFYPISWLDNSLTIFKRIDALAIGCIIAFYKDELLVLLMGKYFKILFYLSWILIFLIKPLSEISKEINFYLDFILILFGTRHGTIGNICIGIILLYSIFINQGFWFQLLNTKVLNYIGLLSYSIYLWQQLFISGPRYWATSFPQNLVLVFVFALFSYYCIEKPFLKLKDKFQ